MSQALWGWAVYVSMLFAGVQLIVGTLLHRAGVKSVFIGRGVKRLNAGTTNILLGTGLALISITGMIPKRESTYVLLGGLYPVAICVMIASFVAWMRQKPVIPDSGHR